jgi:hypothetical protein
MLPIENRLQFVKVYRHGSTNYNLKAPFKKRRHFKNRNTGD